jgi:hypothetical protein
VIVAEDFVSCLEKIKTNVHPSPLSRIFFSSLLVFVFSTVLLIACKDKSSITTIDHSQLATKYYRNDAQWYRDNIPFFECSDKEIEAVYYYRWELYKAHIRNVGVDEYVITEFINDVHWDRDPYSTINAATMHHIYEGRWLKDDRYMDSYINYMYQGGGNNRRYSGCSLRPISGECGFSIHR